MIPTRPPRPARTGLSPLDRLALLGGLLNLGVITIILGYALFGPA